jgi:hypothetical protein
MVGALHALSMLANAIGKNLNTTTKYMFGSAVTKIVFDRIDSVKLILTKIDFKLKWFMYGYIHAKVS